MNYSQLVQFDKKLFKKLFGILIYESRLKKEIPLQKLALNTGIPDSDIKLIESGKKKLDQDQFDSLLMGLRIKEQEVMDIFEITQVRSISELLKVFENAK